MSKYTNHPVVAIFRPFFRVSGAKKPKRAVFFDTLYIKHLLEVENVHFPILIIFSLLDWVLYSLEFR